MSDTFTRDGFLLASSRLVNNTQQSGTILNLTNRSFNQVRVTIDQIDNDGRILRHIERLLVDQVPANGQRDFLFDLPNDLVGSIHDLRLQFRAEPAPSVRIRNVQQLEIALLSFNDEGPYIDLRGLALVWDRDGVTVYEVPLEVWRAEGSPVRWDWNGRWA